MSCPSCGAANAAGNKFCLQCGAVVAPAPTCRACGTSLAPGAKFCTSCGTTVAGAPEIPQGPGYVVDGEWQRAPGELVRKVPGDGLRSAFGRLSPGLDWTAFLRGTLAGKMLDTLLSRTIRVPMGSVGVVTKDGVCVRILPPGEQTSPGLLRDLVAGELGAGAVVERALGAERVSLYLVDRRPVPLSFTVDVPGATGIRTLQATALVSVGADRDSLGAFLNEVVGDKDTLSAEDLYIRFRSEIERAVGDGIRARPSDAPGAEKIARDTLRARFGARTGLRFDLVLAPRHTVHRLDLLLGGGDTLLTADGARIEVDVVLSVQGDPAPSPPTGLLQSTAARFLRSRPWAEVPTADGLAALETALNDAGGDALQALGFRLLALEVVDVRSAGQQWELGSRAAIAQARDEVRVGREWLAVRDDEQALDALTATSSLKAERIRRDSTFAARTLAVEDAKRLAVLEAEERELVRARAAADHADVLTTDAHARERAQARADVESERLRRQAEDEAHVERLRREARLSELTAMTELDARIAAQEQQHKIETMTRLAGQTEAQMIAMQAADLATKEHGGAFAEALGKLADGEAARRERERADRMTSDAMKAMQELAKTSIEASAKVGAARVAAPAVCAGCGATLKVGARFCGECGTTVA